MHRTPSLSDRPAFTSISRSRHHLGTTLLSEVFYFAHSCVAFIVLQSFAHIIACITSPNLDDKTENAPNFADERPTRIHIDIKATAPRWYNAAYRSFFFARLCAAFIVLQSFAQIFAFIHSPNVDRDTENASNIVIERPTRVDIDMRTTSVRLTVFLACARILGYKFADIIICCICWHLLRT